MSARGFKSLYMAAGVATAALGCYLVSLNVASERAKLESVEAEIASTQRDIRVLQTEIGTRGRLAQLERWNANFIRLSAPNADQILEGGFQLATMIRPKDKSPIDAPVVLASAPVEQSVTRAQATDDAATAPASAEEMLHTVSYQRPERAPAATTVPKPAQPQPVKKTETATGKPSSPKSAKIASADPLAPLSGSKSAAKAAAPSIGTDKSKASRKPKESGTPQ